MKTNEFKELYESIDKKATEKTFDDVGIDIMKFPCGFAAIHFPKNYLRITILLFVNHKFCI